METSKQLRSCKRKPTEQRYVHKTGTNVEQGEKQDEIDKYQIMVTPRTPSHLEEEPIEKASES